MITAAALVPHPPLLHRELCGQQDPVGALRTAAEAAVARVVDGAAGVVVVGGADVGGSWGGDDAVAADVRGFGGTGPRAPAALPLSLGVGSRLLHGAGRSGPVELVALPWDAGDDDVDDLAARLASTTDDVALVALGDGSARRGETAPGYLDERAFPFDDAIAQALAEGDALALRRLDVALAHDLMVLGSAAFRLLGAVAMAQGSRPRAALTYRDDPFGVSYLVATWELLPGGPVTASR